VVPDRGIPTMKTGSMYVDSDVMSGI
jgi:hypothetical protein